MSNTPSEAPVAESHNGTPKLGRVVASAVIVMRIAGFITLLYWGRHFITQWQFLDEFRRQVAQDSNPLLGPSYRAFIDISAIVAGILMVARSKWALLPFALHFVGYLCFIASITLGSFDLRLYPRIALIIMGGDAVLLALLLVLEARKALGTWPLRTRSSVK